MICTMRDKLHKKKKLAIRNFRKTSTQKRKKEKTIDKGNYKTKKRT